MGEHGGGVAHEGEGRDCEGCFEAVGLCEELGHGVIGGVEGGAGEVELRDWRRVEACVGERRRGG